MDQHLTTLDHALPLLLEIERPEPGACLTAGSRLTGFGWILCSDRVIAIAVHLNDIKLCQATLGIPRADVADLHPDYAENRQAGFMFTADLPALSSRLPGDGLARLRFTVQTSRGEHLHDVPVCLAAPGALDAALSGLDPIKLELEEATLDSLGFLTLCGWAASLRPLHGIELKLGDAVLPPAETGLPRQDVAEVFPAYPNAAGSGFRLETRVRPQDMASREAVLVVTDTEGESRTLSRTLTIKAGPPRSTMASIAPMLARIEDALVNDRGILRVRGWAVCLVDIEDVTIFLDDKNLGPAEKYLRRDDVGEAHPTYPNAGQSGFLLQLELPDELLSADCVRAVVTAPGGVQRELTAPLAVAPYIRRGGHDETMRVFCDTVTMTQDGDIAGVGWAVCASGIAAIRIEVDGQAVGDAEIGIDRPDVGNNFPNIPSARRAGFRFDLKTGCSWEGEHLVRIVACGTGGEERAILQPALAGAASGAGSKALPGGETEHLKFYLDVPAVQGAHAIEKVRGFMLLNGWAFARTGIAGIEVFVDGQSQGQAFAGIRREDIQAAFPEWDALLSGFAMLVPPQVMKRGSHSVRLVVRDNDGHSEEVAFTVDAEAAPEGPGPWQLRQKMKQAEVDFQICLLAASACRPHWSLLVPMTATEPADIAALRDTLESLSYQAYPEWRITIALPTDHPAATLTESLRTMLAGLDHLARRVAFTHIADDQPLASLVAEDGMFTLLSPGDRLGEDALLEMTVESAMRGRGAFLYSDERRIDPADGEFKAFFKPDWSPDLLLSTNYIGRLWGANAALLARAALRYGDLAEHGEYDAVLRLTEQASAIVHVPKILCARSTRAPGDAAQDHADIERAARDRKALARAAARRGLRADVHPGCLPGIWRLRYSVQAHAEAQSLISIIMPSIASRGLIKTTIDSIRARTTWPAYEIIVLDNIHGTTDPEKLGWKKWMWENADRVIEIDEAFNWSRFNNIGAAAARGDFLLFLNDDMEVHDGTWLHGLMEHAQRPEIGVVGPQLLYPDGRVQHAGIFLSRAVGRHAFRFYPHDAPGPFGLALTQRNMISVTGACMLTRRSVFEAMGGFDEAHSIVNNDLDFSLRLQRAGLRVVYTPHVTLTHHEMVSRANMQDVYNSAHFDSAWKDLFLHGDPFFHPMLTTDYDDYLTEPEPLRQFQVGHPIIARDDVRRILAVKVDHIGDFIAAFPAFRRIKAQFPNAELCVLAAKASLSLAPLEPAIDRVIEFNFFHARSEEGKLTVSEHELLELRAKLAPMRFDIALDLRRQTDTRQILQYTGARWLAGFDQGYTCKWLDIAMEFEGDVSRNFKRSHVTDSLVQFIDVVATACTSDRRVVQAPLDAAEARATLANLPAVAPIAEALFSRPIVCVHTGAGAANKQWPADSFSGLIDMLIGLEGVNVLIIGGPDEAAFAGTVMQGVRRPEHMFSVVAKTSLRDLPVVLRACDLYVGNDSGPKHMAAALGVPTIGIHSGSVDAGEWGPMGPFTITLRRDMTCGPCYIASAADCPRALACLTGISVGDVFRACRRMLLLRK